MFYAKPWQQPVICGAFIAIGLALIVLMGQLAGIVLIVFGVGAGLPLMSLRFRPGRSRPKEISEGDVRR